MLKKKLSHEEHEEHVDESWLVPYADLMTLLLALFIVLFATSSLNEEKYNELKEALYHAFHADLPAGEGSGSIPDDFVFPYPDALVPSQSGAGQSGGAGQGEGTGGMGRLYSSIQEYVQTNALHDTISVESKGEKILLTLKNDIWFASGEKDVSLEMREQVPLLAKILKDNQDEENPFQIIIAGHADNIPMPTQHYTNWDLSVDRAVEFMRLLLKDTDLDPSNFSVSGYGEQQPIATNDTPEGRQKNRRVELLISQTIPPSE